MFLKEVCYAHQSSIYSIKNTVKIAILLQFKITAFYLNIYFKCDLFLRCKAEFSSQLLQSSVSHDAPEIILICWFTAQETFLIIINVKNSYIFCGNHDTWFFDEKKVKIFIWKINVLVKW